VCECECALCCVVLCCVVLCCVVLCCVVLCCVVLCCVVLCCVVNIPASNAGGRVFSTSCCSRVWWRLWREAGSV